MGNVNCCACIPQGEVGFVEQCGKYSRVASPGINCLVPCLCEEVAGKLSMRVQPLDVSVETKTKDNVFVVMMISVQFQAMPGSLYDAFYRLTDSKAQIRSYVFDVVRASVPNIDLDEVFTTKEEIARIVQDELSKAFAGFGYEILQALVTDIDPDPRVKAAMNEINAAQRLRDAALQRAEGEKVTLVKAAEAEAEAAYLQGLGISRQRQAIIDGLRDSVAQFGDDMQGVSPKEVMELLLLTQYFDSVRDVSTASKSSTLFMSHSPAAVNKVALELRAALARDRGQLVQPGGLQTMKR